MPLKNAVLYEKVARLARGEPPRVLDLFSGCGGISLGFHAAGCRIDAAIEIDELAAKTHALNFHAGDARHAKSRDITSTEPSDLTKELGLGPTDKAFDILVGGPPCQAYARVGRAKLREIADHPTAYKIDPRGNLYLRYLHYVKATKPLAILVENVPDVLNYGGHNVMGEIAEFLYDLGYEARYSLINSAFHGVPQTRDRVFLVGIHRSLDVSFSFPSAERHIKLPSGYDGTRAVAYKLVASTAGPNDFVQADHGTSSLPGAVTAKEAIGDLPPITLHLQGLLKRGARRFDEPIPYAGAKHISAFAKSMRQWRGFEAPREGLRDHVIRYLPRDGDIFREMANGAEYPEAHATAERLFEKRIADMEAQTGRHIAETERKLLHRAMVPPYPVGSFPNRWWKLRPDFPVRTLMAHIGKDTYSHIHYDGRQARVISVREAARLQSFPDGFRFCGTMNPAYRQIGNAVPPLMAKQIAVRMLQALREAASPSSIAAE